MLFGELKRVLADAKSWHSSFFERVLYFTLLPRGFSLAIANRERVVHR